MTTAFYFKLKVKWRTVILPCKINPPWTSAVATYTVTKMPVSIRMFVRLHFCREATLPRNLTSNNTYRFLSVCCLVFVLFFLFRKPYFHHSFTVALPITNIDKCDRSKLKNVTYPDKHKAPLIWKLQFKSGSKTLIWKLKLCSKLPWHHLYPYLRVRYVIEPKLLNLAHI